MVIEQQRISRLEGAYEQVDRRLDDMHRAIESLRADLNGLRAEMNSRFNEMSNRYNVLIVVMVGAWVTLIALMIGLYFK